MDQNILNYIQGELLASLTDLQLTKIGSAVKRIKSVCSKLDGITNGLEANAEELAPLLPLAEKFPDEIIQQEFEPLPPIPEEDSLNSEERKASNWAGLSPEEKEK